MNSHDIFVADFTGINISGGYEMVFTQADEFSVRLVMQDNLFRHVETNVRGGILNINSTRPLRTTGTNIPRLHISAPSLESITVTGAVDASIFDLEAQTLTIDMTGAANIHMSGSATRLSITTQGASAVRAFDFTARDANINISGGGTIDISVTHVLDVTIEGVGLVRYKGEPSVTRNTSGLGIVQKVD
jgi:hypothetical protein